MCVSNNFIEQQAYKMTEEIRENSRYSVVGVDYSSGKDSQSNEIALITKVFLEDKDGTQYIVEPNVNGLRFAQGEINYKKYQILQRKNDVSMFICFFGIIGFFSGSMYIIGKFI